MEFKLVISAVVIAGIAILSCEGAHLDFERGNDKYVGENQPSIRSEWIRFRNNEELPTIPPPMREARNQQFEPTWRRSGIHSSVLRQGRPMDLLTNQYRADDMVDDMVNPEVSAAGRIHHETDAESAGNGRLKYNQIRMRNYQQDQEAHSSHENEGINQIYKN